MKAKISPAETATAFKVAMTLAEIAYAQPGNIEALLGDQQLATAGRWQCRWQAADDANQVYIAQDLDTGQYTVAIRGTVTDPFTEAFWLDWFKQDLEAFELVDWPFGGAPAGTKISPGTLAGMQSLIGLRDANGQSMVNFLRAHPSPPQMWTGVVGHSLGGALASVMAPYLLGQVGTEGGGLGFWAITFAAPTAGNAQLGAWLEAEFSASIGRFYNSLDVVPHSWAALDWIASSFPAGPAIPDVVWGLGEAVEGILSELGDNYTQPGLGMCLDGSIAQGDDWFYEAGHQHSGETYLGLLGAPPVPFPSDDPASAR